MLRNVCFGVLIVFGFCCLPHRHLPGQANCHDGCNMEGWTGEIIPDPDGDWCRAMTPAQCIANKKSTNVIGKECIPTGSGTVTYEHCSLQDCVNECNAQTCPVQHQCQHTAQPNQGCTFITTARQYECFDNI